MKTIATFLRALGDPFTWNPRKNLYLWFGLLWGVPVPLFSFYLDGCLCGWAGRSVFDMLGAHPVHYFALAHPFIFAAVFGALGTIRRDLESEKEALIVRLQEMALTDPLTGVCNRRCVLEALEAALHRADRSGEALSVVLFDLDNFKEVNDVQGHLAGDKVLKETALALKSVLRRGDSVGRYGGDEFLAVVPGDRASATTLAERACAAVKDRTGLTLSAGIGVRPDNGSSPATLIAGADRAMSLLKQARYKAHPETRRIALR
ncbi:MAG: GGDEF domain-containing protein [Planctomycetes bacterium]|nr:GGDEF domain-containing protein [Planctomycetota bacterium]